MEFLRPANALIGFLPPYLGTGCIGVRVRSFFVEP